MNNYDILIIGGGTSGCACAYIAGKLGLKVLLVEKEIHLGGAITSGLVIPTMKTCQNTINNDFYNSLILELKKLGGQIDYQGNSGWFNPELTKIALDNLLKNVGVEILFNTEVKSVKILDNKILHAEIDSTILSAYNYQIHTNKTRHDKNSLSECIEAKYFVDATGNANFCQKINCKFLEDNDEFQPISLRFIMSGVDIKGFSKFLQKIDQNRSVTSIENIDGNIHLSTAYTWDTDKQWALSVFFDDAVSKKILKDTDRNYFQIFSVAGTTDSIAFNCPRIVDKLNPGCIREVSNAIIEARAAIYRIAQFCKIYFPGFENAYISNIADAVGIRVSKRVTGKYVYTTEDIRSGKKFNKPVLISNYPIDVHCSDKNSSILEDNGEYQLPIESLMSADYENVFMIGRCLSAEYKAQGALRVQRSCFSMGEGVAKYIYTLLNS